jgi:hypothetical protein
MNSANDKYGSSLDRTLGAGKPVDPATRLSELLAQSLEELTRPFDPPRPGAHPSRPVERREDPPADLSAPRHEPPAEDPAPEPTSEQARVDADRALAELEAELFAAAKQLDGEASAKAERAETDHPAVDLDHPEGDPDALPPDVPITVAAAADENEKAEQAAPAVAAPLPADEPVPDPDAARVIAKVRRLMLVSMAVTVIAVGSVFGFIGYRIYKGEGSVEKKADKLPESSPIPNDITLSLPRDARLVQSAVTNDRLIMTLEIDGKIEVRTFDVKTLQPAGRLNFSATP